MMKYKGTGKVGEISIARTHILEQRMLYLIKSYAQGSWIETGMKSLREVLCLLHGKPTKGHKAYSYGEALTAS